MKNMNIGLSTFAILVLVTNAYAGKIKSNAVDPQNPTVIEHEQYGFGGWNFENVDVEIVNLDGTPTDAQFRSDGTYDQMSEGMSFDSNLKSIDYSGDSPVIGNTIMGQLHGKDWPVGEPAGIKIINDDAAMKHGKPENCIMTTSYLEYQVMIPEIDDTSGTGYLDAWPGEQPNPVICSSPWQTHKRYKINLLPTTVQGVTPGDWGKPVDLVFNLDPDDTDTSIRRYQVLQKANNYTGMRLDGLKIEVLDENGSINDALTLSLGEGEGDAGADIWDESDMANMSHGLWGPYEVNDGVLRFDNGFFDYKRVYFDMNLTDNNHTISYVGPMFGEGGPVPGGNYQEIFGNWLPSIWEPLGIFHDEDENPLTDNILQAFLGVAPGFTERAWYKRSVEYNPDTPNVKPVYTWEAATSEDFKAWSGEWYNRGPIEDVLNLGLNYIINVGENAKIGKTFTLRITPHIATNQTPPNSYLPFVQNDLNGDGISDILWRNTDGRIIVWYMNTDGSYTSTLLSTESAKWSIEHTSDFNGDSMADILWRNTDGRIVLWYMNADASHTSTLLGTESASWSIEQVADFNADGIADILWRNTDGRIVLWYMNADGSHESTLLSTESTNWSISA